MRSNYKPIGNFIHRVENNRNTDLKVTKLLGLSMTKEFRETTSNIVGTDLSVYKVMHKWQFACDFMSPIRVNKLPVVLKMDDEPIIVSPAYPVFEITDRNKLDPEYLMMWFRRTEFDRYATFKCDSAIRGGYDWDELCKTELPVPHIDKQREIIKEYNAILNRIDLNNLLIQKLEETAQAIYKQWFVEFEFPNENGEPYKSAGGEMEFNKELDKEIPKGWEVKALEKVVGIIRGASPRPIEEYMSTDSSGMPWVKISDATASPTKYLNETKEFISKPGISKSRKVSPGTLILSNSASPGLPKIMGIEACVHDGWLIFGDYKNITKELLFNFLLLNREDIVSSSNGSVFNNLKTEILKSYQITVPDSKVLNAATEFFCSIDKVLGCAAKTDHYMNELLSILLSKLATVEN